MTIEAQQMKMKQKQMISTVIKYQLLRAKVRKDFGVPVSAKLERTIAKRCKSATVKVVKGAMLSDYLVSAFCWCRGVETKFR